MKKEKTAEELAAYQAKRAAQRRQWAIDHPEKTRMYGRTFYQRHREQRIASSKAYYQQHKAERSTYSHAYYLRKKAEDPDYVRKMNDRCRAGRIERGWQPKPQRSPMTPDEKRQVRRRYYEKTRLEQCRKKLNEYTDKSIRDIRSRIPQRVELYFSRYPFETYAHKFIESVIHGCFRVRRYEAVYAECYDAGMLAYLYSIHRCAALNCDYVIPYIRKMIRIYVTCALVVYHETREICRRNHLRETHLDAEENLRRY